jgi:uncharacterized protein YqhQ
MINFVKQFNSMIQSFGMGINSLDFFRENRFFDQDENQVNNKVRAENKFESIPIKSKSFKKSVIEAVRSISKVSFIF